MSWTLEAASDIYARKDWRKQDNENCHCTINHGKFEWSLMIPHGYFFVEATILDFLSASWMELQLAGTVTCTSQVMLLLLLFHKLSRFPTNEGLQKTSEQMNGFYPLQSLFKAKQEHKKKNACSLKQKCFNCRWKHCVSIYSMCSYI